MEPNNQGPREGPRLRSSGSTTAVAFDADDAQGKLAKRT